METSQCSQQRRRNDAKMEEAKVERMALIRSTLCIVCHMKRSHSQILILSSKQELLLGSKEQKLHLSKNVCTSYVNNFHLDMSIPTRKFNCCVAILSECVTWLHSNMIAKVQTRGMLPSCWNSLHHMWFACHFSTCLFLV